MAWDDPASVTTGDLITAATWNQDVVDNVQHVHDNRAWCFVLSTVKHDTSSTSYTIASPRAAYYKASLLDESSFNAAYFAANLVATGGASAFVHLYDETAGASIANTRLSTVETSACHVEITSDIKTDLPTGDINLFFRHKCSDGGESSSVRWAGIWFDY